MSVTAGAPTVAADYAAIRAALDVLCEPNAVAELRIMTRGGGIASGYYDDFDALARDAARWSDRNAEGCYVTLNPVNAALLARSPNGVRERAKHTTSDADVLRRTRLLVDLDARRPAGISATDDEHAAALERARAVRDWLAARGWPRTVRAIPATEGISSTGSSCRTTRAPRWCERHSTPWPSSSVMGAWQWIA